MPSVWSHLAFKPPFKGFWAFRVLNLVANTESLRGAKPVEFCFGSGVIPKQQGKVLRSCHRAG